MAHQHLLQQDEANRLRALEPASFIVEAPAGAGKTELLTQRYLKLLSGVAEPEEIVAITFTNKAAAEMRGRVLQSLQDAAANIPVIFQHKERTRELALAALRHADARQWDLLTQPARLRITTIDALSSLLARQMPLLSRLGGQPALVEDARDHYDEAAQRTLALLEEEPAGGPIGRVLQYFDNNSGKLAGLIAAMLSRRDQWIAHASREPLQEEAENALQHLIRKDIESAAALIDEATQRRLMPIARFAASHLACDQRIALLLDWDTPLLTNPQALPLWNALCDLMLTKDGKWRSRFTQSEGFPTGEPGREAKQQLSDLLATLPDPAPLAHIRLLPQPRHEDETWQLLASLSELLKFAYAALLNVFQEAGEIDFIEISQRALEALGDENAPSDLALRLDYRIQHLLVDEFQDTSPSQVQLLERLTAGWLDGDGRTLFCVGDPMQSIYRFRKAEVGLFLTVAESGIGNLQLEKLELYRNNRSSPGVVDWVNRAFAGVFPDTDDATSGAIRYRPFAATRERLDDEGIQIHPLLAAPGLGSEATATHEAATVAALILNLHQRDPEREIAVLVRARTHLHALVTELRKNHRALRFQAVEIEALAGRQVVQDLLALAHALHHPGDRVNWLATLRAPWCGLKLEDMHRLAADDHRATIWRLINDDARLAGLSEDGQHRLAHLRVVLSQAFAQRGRQSLRRWVESTWILLGGPRCLWEKSDVKDVQALLDLIARLDRSGKLETLDAEAEKLYAAPDTAADGKVQFMTIHKSKGLEFDTVILPGLNRDSKNDDPPLVLWEQVPIAHGQVELVAAPLVPADRRQAGPSAYDYLRQLEKMRSSNEDARVLYVAVTRAVRSLHLIGVARQSAKNGDPMASSGTPLAMLWPTVAACFADIPACAETEQADNDFVPALIRLRKIGLPDAEQWPPAMPGNAAVPENGAMDLTELKLDADVGILAHRYLELFANQESRLPDSAFLKSLQPAMQRWLRQRGHPPKDVSIGAQTVTAILEKTLASPDGQWVLQARPQAGNELGRGQRDGQRITQHVIDRTFVENGERWIIDYKSTNLGIHADRLAFESEAEKHRAQLERYAVLFGGENLPCRLAVLFIAHGILIELRQG